MQAREIHVATLGKPSLKARLEAYYSLIAPETIADPDEWRTRFNQIYTKYGGSYQGEQKLALKLAKKYGTAIRLLVAEPERTASPPSSSSLSTSRQHPEQRDESWYALTPGEMNSSDVSFMSTCFNPLRALKLPSSDIFATNPWAEGAPRFDTIAQCSLLLPKGDPQRKEPIVSRKRASTESPTSEPSASKEARTNNNHPFAAVSEGITTGPLARLHTFHRQRIRVVVRYVNAIRGTLTGTLEAFDKHMNFILRDVEEVYSPRPVNREQDDDDISGVVSQLSNMEQEIERRKKMEEDSLGTLSSGEWGCKRRKMKSMLVRGDTVVLVSLADQEQQVAKSRYLKRIPEAIDPKGDPGGSNKST
eukprot:Nitzschia sp. Nitz4//scaffold2_size372955//178430//179586//NITZ4_000424-RA/size372955-processed-gene-0.505-mRNA-1//-1//CDS//3329546781//6803//frame0